VRVYALNANGKAYEVDKVYQLSEGTRKTGTAGTAAQILARRP
jgi:hypothetical protein